MDAIKAPNALRFDDGDVKSTTGQWTTGLAETAWPKAGPGWTLGRARSRFLEFRGG